MKHNFLSPDGFPISMTDFETKDLAIEYLIQWIQGFKRQGYYKDKNNNEIALSKLESLCKYIAIDTDLLDAMSLVNNDDINSLNPGDSIKLNSKFSLFRYHEEDVFYIVNSNDDEILQVLTSENGFIFERLQN